MNPAEHRSTSTVVKTKRDPPWVVRSLLLLGFSLLSLGLYELSRPEKPPRLLTLMLESSLEEPTNEGAYPIIQRTRYRLTDGRLTQLTLDLVDYHDSEDRLGHALLFPKLPTDGEDHGEGLRQHLWQDMNRSIRAHTGEDALFLGWWTTAQRVHFLTGRQAFPRQPVIRALPSGPLRTLFERTLSPGLQEPVTLTDLANWLVMPGVAGLEALRSHVPLNASLYWVSSVDDLAHLEELEALTGVRLPIESQNFPPGTDPHEQIKGVRQWASEGSDDSYLVQPLPGGGIRAYRFTSPMGRESLFARLLPFTHSLTDPLPDTRLVYQSTAGSALLVIDLNAKENP